MNKEQIYHPSCFTPTLTLHCKYAPWLIYKNVLLSLPHPHIVSSIPWASTHLPSELLRLRKPLFPPTSNSICIKTLVTMDSFNPTWLCCPAAWKHTGTTPPVVLLAHPTRSQMALIFQTANLTYVESAGHGVLCLQRREPLQSDCHYVAIWQPSPLTYGLGIGMAVTHLVPKLLKGKRAFPRSR